jgi:hypothetical protein
MNEDVFNGIYRSIKDGKIVTVTSLVIEEDSMKFFINYHTNTNHYLCEKDKFFTLYRSVEIGDTTETLRLRALAEKRKIYENDYEDECKSEYDTGYYHGLVEAYSIVTRNAVALIEDN